MATQRRAWLRGRELLVLALGVCTVGAAVVLALPARSFVRAVATQTAWTAVVAIACVAALTRARREPDAATGWRVIGAAMGLLALSAASVAVELIRAGTVLPFPRLGDWLQLAGFAGCGLGLLVWPLTSGGASVRVRTLVDASLFAVASYGITWGVAIGPMRSAGVPAAVWAMIVSQFTVMTVLLAIVLYLGLGDTGRFRGPLGWIGATGLTAVVGTFAALAAGATSTYYLGHPADILAWLALAVGVGAACSSAPVTGSAHGPGRERDPLLFGGWVTYGSVFAAFAVGLWVLVVQRRDDLVVVLAGFSIVLLLVVRQILSVRDIRHLTATLEAKVEARTRELEASQLTLQRTARLEALGRLAGGVAHDINNLLMGIVGYAELLEMSVDGTDPRRDDILQIRKSVERGARLTRQLLAFARKQPGKPIVLDPSALLSDLERLLHRLIGSDVRLEVRRSNGSGCVRIDPGQLEQVLVNLAVNAREAMPNGGTLTIEVADVEIREQDAVAVPGAQVGAWVRVRVRDTGAGMPPGVMARVFEPFFSTKVDTKGTGLGLSTVYGIVNQAEGFITVESTPGRGTTFDVHLPRVDGKPQWTPAAEAPGVPAGGTETVLVAEDDPAVREVIAAALRGQGYQVLVTKDGEEAVARAQQHRGTIDLLLTDMTMPGMSGIEAASRIAEARPGLRVLVVSGYLADSALPSGDLGFRLESLSKPISPLELTRAVRTMLDEADDNAVGRG